MHAVSEGQLSQSPGIVDEQDDDDDDMENVIVVRMPFKLSPTTPPQLPSAEDIKPVQLPTQRTSSSPSILLPVTRPSPPARSSPSILPVRESTPVGSFTPPRFSQSLHSSSSPGSFSPLPPTTLPLRPGTPIAFLSTFANMGSFGPPGTVGLSGVAFGTPVLSPSGKRKRTLDSSATAVLPTLQNLSIEGTFDGITGSQTSSISEKTDEDEPENLGKKRKIRGIMKKSLQVPVLPSPGVERAELLFNMDKLSIGNDTRSAAGTLVRGQQASLGRETGIGTDMEYGEPGEGMRTLEEERGEPSQEGGGGNSVHGQPIISCTPRLINPLPSRRRLRSPPPPPIMMEEDEGEGHTANTPSDHGDDESLVPPLPSTSIITVDEEGEDDEEDLKSGTKEVFYYKPTPAQRWARNQRRLQQIREYKARESRDAREKRRRRRSSTSSAGLSGVGGGGGKSAAAVRKVRFLA